MGQVMQQACWVVLQRQHSQTPLRTLRHLQSLEPLPKTAAPLQAMPRKRCNQDLTRPARERL
jgi:hypothetical protein